MACAHIDSHNDAETPWWCGTFWRQADKLLKAGIEGAGLAKPMRIPILRAGKDFEGARFCRIQPERGQVLPERYAGYSLEYSGEMVGLYPARSASCSVVMGSSRCSFIY